MTVMKEKKAKTENSDETVLSMYLKEIGRIPLLTRDEEDEAARAAAAGNTAARTKLLNSNLRFVVNVAKRYQGQGIPLVDLISEGNIGLIYAVERYEADRGFHFISYAVWWIRQSILKALCEKSRLIRLPVNQASNLIQIKKAQKMLPAGIVGEQEVKEIARLLGLNEQVVEDVIAISREIISLEQSVDVGAGFSQFGDFVEDRRYEAPEQVMIHKLLENDIKEVLETLNAKEADIIRLRFGLGNQKPLSLKEIGDRMDLTKERIRQIEQKALSRLQHPSRKMILESYVA